MIQNSKARKLSFEEIKELLRDPFRVLVEDQGSLSVCNYGQGNFDVIEDVDINPEMYSYIQYLAGANIVHKGTFQNNVSPDTKIASFFDIHRGDIYGNQTDDAYELAVSLELAET